MSTKVENPDNLPLKPGVYIMKDSNEEIIYVGKSKSLRKRVKSYFKAKYDSPKTYVLMKQFNSLEYIITDTEKEALILEANLIKKYKPRYNIRLKDDKRYPYIKITNETFPRIVITRNITKNGQYYGPFTDVGSIRKSVKFLKSLFKLRTCKNMNGPCLNSQIELCYGPCNNGISKKEYMKSIDKIDLFFQGKYKKIVRELEKEMKQAAKNEKFEKAAALRDQILAINEIMEKQFVDFVDNLDQDIISLAKKDDKAVVVVLSIRDGKIVAKDDFLMAGVKNQVNNEIISAFIKQFYANTHHIPRELVLVDDVKDKELIEEWLSDIKKEELSKLKDDSDELTNHTNNNGSNGTNTPNTTTSDISNNSSSSISSSNNNNNNNNTDYNYEDNKNIIKVVIQVAEEGANLRLVRIATKNAEIIMNQKKQVENALIDLKKYLKLEKLPRIIEGYDISNISGTNAVGSKVSFFDAKPNKKQYKRFKIKTPGPDDYGMMRELIYRRFKNMIYDNNGENATKNHNTNNSIDNEPDLILIDGGKGQLNAVCNILDSLNLGHIPVIGLAKEFEEVFLRDNPNPIIIPQNNPSLHLLQQVRDEAHRFAITYHRKLRSKELKSSDLDNIEGIGPKRKIDLLKHFGDIEKIKIASFEELIKVSSINKKIANNIFEYFH
ncbi:MAG: excinuclease ABC subunit UvrC [Methanobacteriaceae archaeon]